MKEKLTLLLALSFFVGLTVYKYSLRDNFKLDDVSFESIQTMDDTDGNVNITHAFHPKVYWNNRHVKNQ